MDMDGNQRDTTPLGTPDPEAIAEFWDRCRAALPGLPQPAPPAWCFGDSVDLADKLIELVVHGPKRATAGSVAEYEAENEPLPAVGDLSIVTDGSMRPRALLEVTEIRVGPFSSIDEAFAFDEGEGDRTIGWWLDAHTRYFERAYARLALEFHPAIPVVFERFTVQYSEA